MNYLANKKWWNSAGTRAIKTLAQTAIATVGTAVLFKDIDWWMILSASGLAAILSILTSLAGLPEVQDPSKK